MPYPIDVIPTFNAITGNTTITVVSSSSYPSYTIITNQIQNTSANGTYVFKCGSNIVLQLTKLDAKQINVQETQQPCNSNYTITTSGFASGDVSNIKTYFVPRIISITSPNPYPYGTTTSATFMSFNTQDFINGQTQTNLYYGFTIFIITFALVVAYFAYKFKK